MAQKTRVVFVDDLSGDELPDGQGQTVRFSLDGVAYEIDLNKKNADGFRKAVKRYTDAGRKVGRPAARRAQSTRRDVQAIRDWAKANGQQVSERGRLPKQVVEAYEAAR
jgi:hypothetical protein